MKTITTLLSVLVTISLYVVQCPAEESHSQKKVRSGVALSAFMSPMEKEVLDEINSARTNPGAYAAHLEKMRQYYRGKRYERPGKVTIMTREGRPALEVAVEFLGSAATVASLSPSRGMSLGARDLVNEQKSSGAVGHGGSDGSNPGSRVNKYGQWQHTVGENIEYGGENGREVVINMIVDDGVPGRGHRRNIFDPEFRVAGVACDRHPVYRHMCVVVFAGEYTENK